MKLHTLLIVSAAALLLSGEPPKPVAAAPAESVSDGPRPLTVAEFERLQDALRKWRDAENEVKRLQEELAKTAVSPDPSSLVVTHAVTSGGGVCANGSCGISRGRIFTGERRPVRRVFSRVPRLFGRR